MSGREVLPFYRALNFKPQAVLLLWQHTRHRVGHCTLPSHPGTPELSSSKHRMQLSLIKPDKCIFQAPFAELGNYN